MLVKGATVSWCQRCIGRLSISVQTYVIYQISNRPEYLEWPTDLLEGFLKEEDELSMRNDDGSCVPPQEVELMLLKRILNYVRHDQTNRYLYWLGYNIITDKNIYENNVGRLNPGASRPIAASARGSYFPNCPLQWRHSERDGVSNHQPPDCLLNRLFRRRSKKTSKLRVTSLCAGNSPVIGEFPAQRASNSENISVWWRHHANYT